MRADLGFREAPALTCSVRPAVQATSPSNWRSRVRIPPGVLEVRMKLIPDSITRAIMIFTFIAIILIIWGAVFHWQH